MITIRVDHENNGEQFWPALTGYDVIHMAPVSDSARRALAELTTSGIDAVQVSETDADEIEEFFATLPGWDDGPEYAPHPVLFEE